MFLSRFPAVDGAADHVLAELLLPLAKQPVFRSGTLERDLVPSRLVERIDAAETASFLDGSTPSVFDAASIDFVGIGFAEALAVCFLDPLCQCMNVETIALQCALDRSYSCNDFAVAV